MTDVPSCANHDDTQICPDCTFRPTVRPTSASTKYIQTVGRILRTQQGKERAKPIDVDDES